MAEREGPPAPARERLLPLTGAFNFRDLGGYPAGDGRETRWGRVFRSDTLHELTAADLELLRRVGLQTVVDLRTPKELANDGRGRLADEPVRHIHLSVLPDESGGAGEAGEPGESGEAGEAGEPGESRAAPPPVEGGMAARYLWYLEVGGDRLAEALRLVAAPEHQPLVFHCMAGKDRTGVLSALVLDCLGVQRAVIVEDYVRTAPRLHLIVERLRAHPIHGTYMRTEPPPRVTVEAEVMEGFLDGLDARYGGAAGWARSAGVTQETLDALRRSLLQDPPDEQAPVSSNASGGR